MNWADTYYWNILPENVELVNQCRSFEAAVHWCNHPWIYQETDWFWTKNEFGQKTMMRVEKAKRLNRHILEHVVGKREQD
jgi:hypothetical protein